VDTPCLPNELCISIAVCITYLAHGEEARGLTPVLALLSTLLSSAFHLITSIDYLSVKPDAVRVAYCQIVEKDMIGNSWN
jgi:hypothetical protein